MDGNNMFSKEKIYIAGPECFYAGGYDALDYMKRRAESLGFHVTLPNSNPLDLDNEDLRKRADSIFQDLEKDMNASTAIIADLEAYRGSEADSGTIYEIGMAYARGIGCYGYTRDKRTLAWKDQKYTLGDGVVYDEAGRPAPYKDLPFSPCVVGSTKIVEGDFDDCLKLMMLDVEEGWKQKGRRGLVTGEMPVRAGGKRERPLVYLAGPQRYDPDSGEQYRAMKAVCARYGLDAVTPADWAEGVEKVEWDNPYVKAANLFDNYQQHVRDCDAVVADLNDFRGYECSNDVAFECGMGFQLGKKLFGYVKDSRPLIQRIPHLGEEMEFRDMTGANVENFNYPMNLMFACSMEIGQGQFEDIIRHVAEML